MPVWKTQLVRQAGLHNFIYKYRSEQEPFSQTGRFWNIWRKPWWHLPTPALPWQPFFLCFHVSASGTAGEARGGKWSPASLSKAYLLGSHYAGRLGSLSTSATTAFLSSMTVLRTREPLTEHSGNLILRKKNHLAGVLWRCWAAPELAGAGQCLCTGASCSLCFWLHRGQGRKRRCRGQAVGFRSCRCARCAKSFSFWLIQSKTKETLEKLFQKCSHWRRIEGL